MEMQELFDRSDVCLVATLLGGALPRRERLAMKLLGGSASVARLRRNLSVDFAIGWVILGSQNDA